MPQRTLKQIVHGGFGEEQQLQLIKQFEAEKSLRNLEILSQLQDLVLFSTSNNAIKAIITVFARKLVSLLDEENILDSEELSQDALKCLKNFWSLCSSQQNAISSSELFGKWDPALLEAVTPLASICIDLFIAAHGHKDNLSLWSKKLYSWLNLDLSDRAIKVALLEVTGHLKDEAAIAGPLVSKVLTRPFDEDSNPEYLLHFLLVKKWQGVKTVSDLVQMSKSLRAPPSFLDWLQTYWNAAGDYIPEDKSLKGSMVSQFLLDLDTDDVLESLTDVLQMAVFPDDTKTNMAADDSVMDTSSAALFVVDKKGSGKKKSTHKENGNTSVVKSGRKRKACEVVESPESNNVSSQKGLASGEDVIEVIENSPSPRRKRQRVVPDVKVACGDSAPGFVIDRGQAKGKLNDIMEMDEDGDDTTDDGGGREHEEFVIDADGLDVSNSEDSVSLDGDEMRLPIIVEDDEDGGDDDDDADDSDNVLQVKQLERSAKKAKVENVENIYESSDDSDIVELGASVAEKGDNFDKVEKKRATRPSKSQNTIEREVDSDDDDGGDSTDLEDDVQATRLKKSAKTAREEDVESIDDSSDDVSEIIEIGTFGEENGSNFTSNMAAEVLRKKQILLSDPVASSYFGYMKSRGEGSDIEVIEEKDDGCEDEEIVNSSVYEENQFDSPGRSVLKKSRDSPIKATGSPKKATDSVKQGKGGLKKAKDSIRKILDIAKKQFNFSEMASGNREKGAESSKKVNSPTKAPGSTKKALNSPTKTTGSPKKAIDSPTKATGSPKKALDSSTKATGSSKKAKAYDPIREISNSISAHNENPDNENMETVTIDDGSENSGSCVVGNVYSIEEDISSKLSAIRRSTPSSKSILQSDENTPTRRSRRLMKPLNEPTSAKKSASASALKDWLRPTPSNNVARDVSDDDNADKVDCSFSSMSPAKDMTKIKERYVSEITGPLYDDRKKKSGRLSLTPAKKKCGESKSKESKKSPTTKEDVFPTLKTYSQGPSKSLDKQLTPKSSKRLLSPPAEVESLKEDDLQSNNEMDSSHTPKSSPSLKKSKSPHTAERSRKNSLSSPGRLDSSHSTPSEKSLKRDKKSESVSKGTPKSLRKTPKQSTENQEVFEGGLDSTLAEITGTPSRANKLSDKGTPSTLRQKRKSLSAASIVDDDTVQASMTPERKLSSVRASAKKEGSDENTPSRRKSTNMLSKSPRKENTDSDSGPSPGHRRKSLRSAKQ